MKLLYDEIEIGRCVSLGHIITKEDVDKFIALTKDDNPVHTSDKYGIPVVHGMLSASFISTLIGTELPGEGALWYGQTLDFLAPVRIGDHLTITATVKEKYDRDRIITLNIGIENQQGDKVLSGISKIKVLEELEHKPNLKDKKQRVAYVIGGTGGIGRAVVAEFSRLGFNVIATYSENSSLAFKLKEDFGCEISHCVLGKTPWDSIDGVDVLVNCSAVPIPNIEVFNLDNTKLFAQFDHNITHNLSLAQEVFPHMNAQKYGKIIFIGSTVIDSPRGHWAHYIIAKEALWGLTKALSYEWAPKGIRVNMVSPSLIKTVLTANISEKDKLILESQTPLRTTTTPEQVAKVIGFLASEAGDSVTGQNIRING